MDNPSHVARANGVPAIAARRPADPDRLAMLCRAVFERVRQGIVLLDGNTAEIVAANPFFLSLAMCGADDIGGKRLWEIPLFRDLDISRKILERVRTRLLVQYEDLVVHTASGQALILDCSFEEYSTEGGKIIQCNIVDVTNRKQREIARRRSHTMQALGRMASRLADELNGVLPALGAAGESRGDSLGRVADELRQAKGRMDVLVRELSLFGGAQVVQQQPVNLNAVIDSMDGEIRSLLGEGVELIKLPGAGLAAVRADEWQIRRMIRKLVVNACTAMPEGGVLKIQTGRVEGSAATAGEAESGSGGCTWLSVTDSGRRLDGEAWSRLFEPFQTPGGGEEDCGFGLASVYGIVKQAGGQIAVSSGLQSGTTFRVHLPSTGERTLAEPAGQCLEQAEHGAGTILILEQEEGLRNVMRNLLARKGYSVAEARTEAETWEFLRSAGPTRLIVADVASFGLSGARLVREMAETHPSRKALFILESSGDLSPSSGFVAPGATVLVKPFRLEALLAKLREVLGE